MHRNLFLARCTTPTKATQDNNKDILNKVDILDNKDTLNKDTHNRVATLNKATHNKAAIHNKATRNKVILSKTLMAPICPKRPWQLMLVKEAG